MFIFRKNYKLEAVNVIGIIKMLKLTQRNRKHFNLSFGLMLKKLLLILKIIVLFFLLV